MGPRRGAPAQGDAMDVDSREQGRSGMSKEEAMLWVDYLARLSDLRRLSYASFAPRFQPRQGPQMDHDAVQTLLGQAKSRLR